MFATLLDNKSGFIHSIVSNPDKMHHVYFGLKAAPLTLAHEKIIKYLYDEFLTRFDNVHLRIGVANSKWKDDFKLFEMVDAYVKENYPDSKMIKVKSGQDTFWWNCKMKAVNQYQTVLYDFLTGDEYGGKDTLIVLGEDEWNHLVANDGVWKKAEDLVDKYMYFHCAKNRNDEISATKVREILYRDPDVDYYYVKDYISKWTYDWIKKNGIFWQLKPNYRAEENNFIEKYDPGVFDRPSVTVDNIAWTEKDNKKLVLLVRRKGHPYKGFWALPGGFLDMKKDDSLLAAARRELEEETHLSEDMIGVTTNQVKAYSDKGVDPRTRIVDVVFESKFKYDDLSAAYAGDDAAQADLFDVDNLPRLGFNHKQIIEEFFKQT